MEMMMCVLILALASAVITNTLVLGINQFKSRTRETEARLLCNALSLAVQDQLTYVREAEADDEKNLGKFRSSAEGFQDVQCALLRSTEGKLYMEYNLIKIPLADDAAYVSDLYVGDDFSIKINDNGWFQVTITVKSNRYTIQSATNTFTVKPIFKIPLTS